MDPIHVSPIHGAAYIPAPAGSVMAMEKHHESNRGKSRNSMIHFPVRKLEEITREYVFESGPDLETE